MVALIFSDAKTSSISAVGHFCFLNIYVFTGAAGLIMFKNFSFKKKKRTSPLYSELGLLAQEASL